MTHAFVGPDLPLSHRPVLGVSRPMKRSRHSAVVGPSGVANADKTTSVVASADSHGNNECSESAVAPAIVAGRSQVVRVGAGFGHRRNRQLDGRGGVDSSNGKMAPPVVKIKTAAAPEVAEACVEVVAQAPLGNSLSSSATAAAPESAVASSDRGVRITMPQSIDVVPSPAEPSSGVTTSQKAQIIARTVDESLTRRHSVESVVFGRRPWCDEISFEKKSGHTSSIPSELQMPIGPLRGSVLDKQTDDRSCPRFVFDSQRGGDAIVANRILNLADAAREAWSVVEDAERRTEEERAAFARQMVAAEARVQEAEIEAESEANLVTSQQECAGQHGLPPSRSLWGMVAQARTEDDGIRAIRGAHGKVFLQATGAKAAILEARTQARCLVRAAQVRLEVSEQQVTSARVEWERCVEAATAAAKEAEDGARREAAACAARVADAEARAQAFEHTMAAVEELRSESRVEMAHDIASQTGNRPSERNTVVSDLVQAAGQLCHASQRLSFGVDVQPPIAPLPVHQRTCAQALPSEGAETPGTYATLRGSSSSGDVAGNTKRQRLTDTPRVPPALAIAATKIPPWRIQGVSTKSMDVHASDPQSVSSFSTGTSAIAKDFGELLTDITQTGVSRRRAAENIVATQASLDRARRATTFRAQLRASEQEGFQLASRLASLHAEAGGIVPEKAITKLRAVVGAWQERRRLCMSTLRGIKELRRSTMERLIDEYEVVTDEAVGVSTPDVLVSLSEQSAR
eukprot:TRINITY_DN44422_c0_g1_i1.p1 TRINITY_DN44422_c0_g1~~TRINITY_DN44422_c0_g1_i1.p1  ORF type:complete len:815 (-),score=134.97 TRINITY_DN44422_c0_g1_i1:103-2340(-)